MHLHLSINGWLKGCEGDSRCLLLTPKVRRVLPLCLGSGVVLPGWRKDVASSLRKGKGQLSGCWPTASPTAPAPGFVPVVFAKTQPLLSCKGCPEQSRFHCQPVMSGHWTLSWTSCRDRAGVKSSPTLWLHPSPWDLTKKLPSCGYKVRGHRGRGAVAPQYSQRLENCHRPCRCAVPLAREELTHRSGVAVGGGATSTDLGSADDVAPLV